MSRWLPGGSLLSSLLLFSIFLAAARAPTALGLATSISDPDAPDPFTLPGVDVLIGAMGPLIRPVMVGGSVVSSPVNPLVGVFSGDVVRFASSFLQVCLGDHHPTLPLFFFSFNYRMS